jgi:eukaryotic-like serine/threonine-protein kinase
MTPERWRRIEEIYEAAQQRTPEKRAAFLAAACGDDEPLRREVERLIAANDQAGNFLASPAWEVAPSALVAGKIADDREMSLVGRQVGHYQILAPLGRGGMGEVYRAHDTTLNREVALKVLPDLFACNADRLARFTREAHVLASLNHPNIGAIYGFEHTEDIKAIVLELVEGPTLADRIAFGPITLDEALPIARQIADALEAAHERGIVHRDLKPANVKVRADGMVKVLDFGLAKAFDVDSPSGVGETQSPTVPRTVVTADGIVVGTAPYMAPEQARGKPADKRADLWAFGCVLYEMLTGLRTFAGDDTSETLAAVLKDEPDWHTLSTETPVSIRRLLRRCLAKDPKRRLSDASVARLEIDEALGEPQPDVLVETTSRRTERIAWASALLLVAAAAVAAVVFARRPESPAGEVRFEINTPPTSDALSLAISPDEQNIVFVATHEGRNKLWIRRLDSVSAEPLAGTDGATAPFWSPDSRTVGFFTSTDNQLKRIDIDSRLLRVLGRAPIGTGGSWNQDGTILFSSLAGSWPILRISEAGGEPTPLTRLEPAELSHQFPQFLPDGRHFLYYSPNPPTPAVFVAQLDRSEKRRLLDADTAAVYLGSGYLLFVRGGTLYAQPFDADRLALTGDPFRVAGQVATALWLPALSASAASTLVYRAGSSGKSIALIARPLVWFDRSGKEVSRFGSPIAGAHPSLSPDGRQVAVFRSAGPTSPPDIWILDLARDVSSRLTSNGIINLDPIWSPDGRDIVFSASVKKPIDVFGLYRKRADGTGNEELLVESPQNKRASDWSREGFLLYTAFFLGGSGSDIWVLPMRGDRKPFAVVSSRFEERDGQFSPDGRWIAYQSNNTGQFEIYIRPFHGPGPPKRVSTNGGAQVRWRRDGSELFYIALDDRLTAVPIRFASDGTAVDVGTPTPLFPTHVGGAVSGLDRQQYVVSPDGQRFLMSVVPEDANPSPINVILDWQPRPAN